VAGGTLGLTDAEEDHVEAITALMEDASTGFGYKKSSTAKADGTPRESRVSLSCEDAAAMDYAKAQVGVSSFGRSYFRDRGLVTHWERSDSTRTLGSKELGELTDSDKDRIKAHVLAKMGLTLTDWDRLNQVPCLDKGLVAKFDAAVYEIKVSGGRLHDLARCLEIPMRSRTRGDTSGRSCPRLQDAIRRHKQRLAQPESHGVTTCAAEGCDSRFYRSKPSHKFCSVRCQQKDARKRLALPIETESAVCAGDDCNAEFQRTVVGKKPPQEYCSPRCRRRGARLRARARRRSE
jgi:hypothetical protein